MSDIMNREIKFRGKCSPQSKYQGEWITGSLVVPEIIKDNELLIVVAHSDNCKTTYHVDKDTVGQFTGLRDKNGREIYEGDILTADEYPFMKDGNMNYIAVIEWFDYDVCWYASLQLHRDSKARGISVNTPAWFDKETAETYEVIGNIHDNPELIKEEKK